MSFAIRLARLDDLERIDDIYNHYVRSSTCTYQEEAEPIASRRVWFDRHDPAHPITVAELEGAVVGWGSLSPFRERSAYRFTVENSVYVDHQYQRRGIGGALLADLIGRARVSGHRTIIAAIDAAQDSSIAVHARYGFVTAGRLHEVGYKFDRWLDVVYMQLMLR
jgi:phosphinothricin acetyltransferase